jgi:dTDP-4-dehydrorhamnose 3,5-epimerase
MPPNSIHMIGLARVQWDKGVGSVKWIAGCRSPSPKIYLSCMHQLDRNSNRERTTISMPSDHPIHDLYIEQLTLNHDHGLTSWVPLRDDDHLLRRFGQVEVMQMDPAAPPRCQLRAIADEAWALLSGSAEFRWRDFRAVSPTEGRRFSLQLREPTVVLVPFGVGFGVQALQQGVLLVRISTHEDGTHPGDRILTWEDLV